MRFEFGEDAKIFFRSLQFTGENVNICACITSNYSHLFVERNPINPVLKGPSS